MKTIKKTILSFTLVFFMMILPVGDSAGMVTAQAQTMVYVTPTGTRRRGNTTTRNAEIAYVNEYGTDSIQARGFIRKANEKCADETTTAEFMVYNRFLESKNL